MAIQHLFRALYPCLDTTKQLLTGTKQVAEVIYNQKLSMDGDMKFKLTSGDSSFSFEGELQDAQALLDAYWNPQPKATTSSAREQDTVGPKKSTKPRAKRKKATPTDAAAASASIDAQELANTIKKSEQFKLIKERILDVKSEWELKCKLVAHFANEPITSGDVKRTLDALKIKCSLSTLSKTLTRNADQFITKGDNPVKYELTSAAESEFVAWLDENSND